MTESNKPPYEYEDVTAILIEPMADFLEIQKGSLSESEIGLETNPTRVLTAIDSFNGEKLFFFAHRLAAVRYRPEELKVVEGGVSHLARPLP